MRVSSKALSFATIGSSGDGSVLYEPYLVKSGISMAANLREAFADSELLGRGFQRVQVLVDAPVLVVPLEEFEEEHAEMLYRHAFLGYEKHAVHHAILPDLNAVALFAINKDLRLVITDHFQDVKLLPLMQPVWSHLHRKSFTGRHQKLYAYFHDKRMEVCAFRQNRFRFCNSFDASHAHDAVYYLLYVWKQLAFDAHLDELHIVGAMPERDWLVPTLQRYLEKAFVINPSAEFNRAPVTQIKNIPYDLVTLFMR